MVHDAIYAICWPLWGIFEARYLRNGETYELEKLKQNKVRSFLYKLMLFFCLGDVSERFFCELNNMTVVSTDTLSLVEKNLLLCYVVKLA